MAGGIASGLIMTQTKQENQVDNLITQESDALILIAVSSYVCKSEKVVKKGLKLSGYDQFC